MGYFEILGIDEHFFTKKKGFATTLCNLSKHKVHDVVLGRSDSSLSSYLSRLKGRQRTQVVVMDLSETYRNIAKRYFKKAMIVADRFHVVRLINHKFLKQWRLLDPSVKWSRGLLSLMRRHCKNLKPKQRENLSRYFKENPAVEALYWFKQKLTKLMTLKRRTKKQCKRLVPRFLSYLEELKCHPFEEMITLGKTLTNWQEEIVRMWRFTKTNSITEGFHNKMETITRRAYGFRNFQNYRLRVRALCS